MKKIKIFFAILSILAGFMFPACNKSGDNDDDDDNGNNTIEEYTVFAWNDLGMHCLNPTYDKAVILPPYNTLIAQVVKRGVSPEIITTGLDVTYKILNNTSSYNKRSYGGFWDFFETLFDDPAPAHDIGMTGKGLSGKMRDSGDRFIAEGIPVVPVDDDGVWNPYQVAEIIVKNAAGTILAQTRATLPTSDEISCTSCHGPDAFNDILSKHDALHETTLFSSKPVLCASCHLSPAYGNIAGSKVYLSKAIHGSHATRGASCYDCHPGTITKCNRSLAHNNNGAADGNCISCHGTMANVANTITSGRVPWVSEPGCKDCHSASVLGVNTGTTLYRNAKGHGDIYCSACHGSPHAMYPSREAVDNYQPEQYQSIKIKTIGSCGVCHSSSRGRSDLDDFSEKHGSLNPEKTIGCSLCHTSIPVNTSLWPHSYTWTNTN
jgi:hypothetical protein